MADSNAGRLEAGAGEKYALIGAGPKGLAMAKVLREQGTALKDFELHADVGGLRAKPGRAGL